MQVKFDLIIIEGKQSKRLLKISIERNEKIA